MRPVFAGKNLRFILEVARKLTHLRFIDQADRFRPNEICLRRELFRVPLRSQPDNLHPLGNILRDFERAFADRTGRAENHYTFSLHDVRQD